MVGIKGFHSSETLFQEMGILKFDDLFDFVCTKLMFKCSKSLLPTPILSIFERLSHSNRSNSFKIEKCKNKFMERFPTAFLPRIWNANSLSVRLSQSLDSLARTLSYPNRIYELMDSFDNLMVLYLASFLQIV